MLPVGVGPVARSLQEASGTVPESRLSATPKFPIDSRGDAIANKKYIMSSLTARLLKTPAKNSGKKTA